MTNGWSDGQRRNWRIQYSDRVSSRWQKYMDLKYHQFMLGRIGSLELGELNQVTTLISSTKKSAPTTPKSID